MSRPCDCRILPYLSRWFSLILQPVLSHKLLPSLLSHYVLHTFPSSYKTELFYYVHKSKKWHQFANSFSNKAFPLIFLLYLSMTWDWKQEPSSSISCLHIILRSRLRLRYIMFDYWGLGGTAFMVYLLYIRVSYNRAWRLKHLKVSWQSRSRI